MERDNQTTVNNLPQDMMSNLAVQLVFYVIYSVIFFLGLFGNMLVIFVVGRNHRMQTVTNLFIANLALSDMLLCLLAVPFTPLYTFLGGWVFGKTLCHLVPYSQAVSVYISTLTLTSIAVDRFLVIIYPFQARMMIRTCLVIIMGIWLISLLITLPFGLYMRQIEDESHVFWCAENWPSESFRQIFSAFTSVMQYVVPFFVIAFCYICVSIKLNDRVRAKPGNKSNKREEEERERKRRTNRMLIAMVSVFGVCWLPLNIALIIADFYTTVYYDWPYFRFYFFISHCIAMSSTCYNPFLYAWLNENFRKEFQQILPCFLRSANGNIPRTNETCRGDKIDNGNNTMQETLLASTKAQNLDGCEMIMLERTTNAKNQLNQPSCSKDSDDTL
ncbi:prolactin-releasing peptide receptor-like isoform X1 [Solenopsis invicta]|uniref:prolactin-releasing peptide receptor-like isoform X1 n=1 Tax=Solenopsis invicta TaxID=13686 RepID=UPI0001FE89FE|nr:prolactin-releasing peptide receptor-like isoform X1 [Solenopsis invicta]XP_025991731.1 prolactin-releasing peptide receptor-like isoform X1 [Solenopsis invicta]XP_025991733.1 prolactin-releasing peptide receptor-like isoform X1 [Solenopsis invicta]XP_025991734.1 prolactin-releasing peptide receptor-like isoform X1 [Solenopsis invicta]XP_039308218.1 prolactin-releasing peptide receptor-like isoform X1 [Solenopsis invicta]